MESMKLLQSFALNKSGEIVSIHDVERGKACECCCSECGEVLISRQGDIRAWHFAHESGADCDGAAEGALHKAAKQLLAFYGRVKSPRLVIHAEEVLTDGRRGGFTSIREGTMIDLKDIRMEKTTGSIRPDISAVVKGKPIFIEIAVTHFVDQDKLEKLRMIGVACIEIYISPEECCEWTWDKLREEVIYNTSNRSWLVHHKYNEWSSNAAEMAKDNALSKDIPSEIKAHSGHTLTRFILRGVNIQFIEFTWGLTLRTAYFHESVTPLIADLAKRIGGRWNGEYNSWKLHTGVRKLLLDELKGIGAIER